MCSLDDFPPYDDPNPLRELDQTEDRAHFRTHPPEPAAGPSPRPALPPLSSILPLPGMVGHECGYPAGPADAWCIRVDGHPGRHVFARLGL